MINAGILRTTDNDSSTRNLHKGASSEQKLPRLKAKALGDVQNTLHSRSNNFVNSNTNSAVKAPTKSAIHIKSVNNASGKETNVTPRKSAVKSLLSAQIFAEEFEFHNHKLCEDDQQFYLDDYFKQYKFSDEQISNITRSVKSFVSPPSVSLCEPCEDIELPDVKKCEEKRLSISDIFNDEIPEIPPLPTVYPLIELYN